MTDRVTRVRSENYFQRLGNSFVGMVLGLVLVVLGCLLLFWNDGRAVDAQRGLNAGARQAVSLATPAIDPANEGKLVHFSGPIAATAPIKDMTTGAEFSGAVVVVRKAEMYQWVETSESQTREKVGGTQETTTVTTYAKQWSDQPQDSSSFAEPAGHQNPTMAVTSDRFSAADATIGAFSLNEAVLASLSGATPAQPATIPQGWRAEGSSIMRGTGTAEQPQVGDLRVTYSVVPVGTVISVMGRQSGSGLAPWSRNGSNYEILMAQPGRLEAGQMIAEQKANEQLLTWILRGVGTLMNIIGFAMLLGPLSALANVLPPVANLIAGGAGLVALALGLPISLLVIGIAWLVFRPLLALALIGVGVAVFVVLSRRKGAAGAGAAATA